MIVDGIDYTGCRVTIEDVRAAKLIAPVKRGYCVNGMRTFARLQGLDFATFAREGLPLDVFYQYRNNDMARAVIEEAMRRWAAQKA